jgi:hypothetical protein
MTPCIVAAAAVAAAAADLLIWHSCIRNLGPCTVGINTVDGNNGISP